MDTELLINTIIHHSERNAALIRPEEDFQKETQS
jgi:hypothetical protein